MFVANIAGVPDLAILGILIVLLFGGSQLPKIARNIGMAGKEFKKAHDEAAKPDPVAPATPSVPAPPPAVTAGVADDRVTLSRSELDALLAEREERAKRQATS
ncbi:MAG: twin-arginine translocase TatA/TatE family subunit [Acidimicrobiales bacterium]